MLPQANRLRKATDWDAIRSGASSGRRTVVIKVARIDGDRILVGFAVSRAVGGAVVRNTVKRRLRAILRTMLPDIPHGRAVLVRALPPSATASYSLLEGDVREAATRALGKVAP